MGFWPHRSLAPAALLFLAAPAAGQDFLTASVTPEMTLSAVDECTRQLRAGIFDHQRLTGAGWVNAIRSDGGDVDIRGYRHPDNMILLHIIDRANEPDRCSVMAPTGLGLSLEAMRSALRERHGAPAARRGDQIVWELEDLVLVLKPMSRVGVLIEVDPRSGDAGRRPR